MKNSVRTYLYAEAIRNLEEYSGEVNNDPEIFKRACAAADSFPARIIARAGLLAAGLGLEQALERSWKHLLFTFLGCAVLCFILGAALARAIPEGYPARANIMALLAVLLLPNLVSLLLWLIITLGSAFRPGVDRANAWLGRRVYGLNRILEKLLPQQPENAAAVRTWKEFLMNTPPGRRQLVIVSHSLWLVLLAGAYLSCWWLMAVRQVDFVWGTTVLTPERVQLVLGKLTDIVSIFGFTVPDMNDILASRIDIISSDEMLRRDWGLFLLGAIITLGVVPRLIALSIDTCYYLFLSRNLKPDLGRKGYARLQPYLMPLSHHNRLVDADQEAVAETRLQRAAATSASSVPVSAVWLALDHVPDSLPDNLEISADLGVVASFTEQTRAQDRLRKPDRTWQAVCVCVDLALTPDRGMSRLLHNLHDASRLPLHVVLVVSGRARSMRDSDRELRLQDWVQLVLGAGVQQDQIHQI